MKTKSLFAIKPFILALVFMLGSVTPILANPPSKMSSEWKRAKEYTKEYLDAMPEDGVGFKPTNDIRSFAEQMLHIANANYAFASAASGKANPN